MKLNINEIMDAANKLYVKRKIDKGYIKESSIPYMAPEIVPQIMSDQVKSVAEAIVNAINDLHKDDMVDHDKFQVMDGIVEFIINGNKWFFHTNTGMLEHPCRLLTSWFYCKDDKMAASELAEYINDAEAKLIIDEINKIMGK